MLKIPSIMLKNLLAVALLIVTGPVFAGPDSLKKTVLLVAADHLPDPRFAHSVVLVTRHNKNGPVGVIINRPLNVQLQDAFPNEPGLEGNDEAVFFGGPVSKQTVVFLLRAETPPASALHVFDDVYMSLSKELFEKTLQRENPTAGLRIFIGYAGWSEEQLQREIDNGDWNLMDPDHETVYSDAPEQLWQKLSKKFRGEWVLLPHEVENTEIEAPLSSASFHYLATH
ncbi:MAG: YqgE/AlgH family protein [Gammaproteobacteria bacterium]|nr:MAG: YqgE/AlgH family protein [Gammaproteobacteria bacterium]